MTSEEIRAGDDDQPCLAALDKQEEFFDHPCPDCTGHPSAIDDNPVDITRTPFPHGATEENRTAFAVAADNYASNLCRLYWAWISTHWLKRQPDGFHGTELVMQKIIADCELVCRQEPYHGWQNHVGDRCDCAIATTPAAHNFALQRRYDMALQCSQAVSVINDLMAQQNHQEHVDYESIIDRSEAVAVEAHDAISEGVRTRNPPLATNVRPYHRGQYNERVAYLQGDIPTTSSQPGSPFHAVVRVLQNMINLLALDTGLTLVRASAVVRFLKHQLFYNISTLQKPRGWPLIRPPARVDCWPTNLRNLLRHNARPYWDRYACELDFVLGAGDQINVTWNWWLTSVTPFWRRRQMMNEWTGFMARCQRRADTAEQYVQAMDEADVPGGAECYICGSNFTSIEPPFDVAAEPRRCIGLHQDIAGVRCLTCFACSASTVPTCPFCRRCFNPRDDATGNPASSPADAPASPAANN